MQRLSRAIGTFLVISPLLTGCSSSTVGPDEGSAEAFVSDDPAAQTTYAGTAAGDFFASVSTDGRTWANLGTPNGITVQLQSSDATTVHGAQGVPPAEYRWVRLSFRDVELKIAEGSTIGGTTFDEEQTVELAPDEPGLVPIQVEPFRIDEVSAALISFDLNSEEWLTAARVQAGTIAAEEVVDHVTVSVR